MSDFDSKVINLDLECNGNYRESELIKCDYKSLIQ